MSPRGQERDTRTRRSQNSPRDNRGSGRTTRNTGNGAGRGNRRSSGDVRASRSAGSSNRAKSSRAGRNTGNRGGGRGGAKIKVAPDHSNRAALLLIIFAALCVVLVGRLAYLQLIDGGSLAENAEDIRTRTIPIPATRGTIYDRNGNVIASTIPAYDIYADPSEVTDPAGEAEQLAAILGGDVGTYVEKLSRDDTSFVYIERKVESGPAEQVLALELPGIHSEDNPKRVYPYEGVGSQVIGVTNIDGEGITGLELQYDELLRGEDGQLVEQRGLHSTPMASGVVSSVDKVDGLDMVTTIDIELQGKVEQILAQALSENELTEGGIIVYDGGTGEIYAAASGPLLNVGPDWRESESAAFNLSPVTQIYEPGSTFKSITATAVCDTDTLSPDSPFEYGDELIIDDFVIHDHEDHGWVAWTLSDIIAQSSNIGTVLASQTVARDTLMEYIIRFGFGQDPGVDFPGASSGSIPELGAWTSATAANIPFGQGMTATELQVIRAYGAFASGGTLQTPHFLLDIPSDRSLVPTWESKRIIKGSTVTEVDNMLEQVVVDGTSPDAAIAGFTVIGKSGTAQFAEGGSYVTGRGIISFVGYLRYADSDLVVMVMLRNADDNNNVTPAVFRQVMVEVIDQYGIEPA